MMFVHVFNAVCFIHEIDHGKPVTFGITILLAFTIYIFLSTNSLNILVIRCNEHIRRIFYDPPLAASQANITLNRS